MKTTTSIIMAGACIGVGLAAGLAVPRARLDQREAVAQLAGIVSRNATAIADLAENTAGALADIEAHSDLRDASGAIPTLHDNAMRLRLNAIAKKVGELPLPQFSGWGIPGVYRLDCQAARGFKFIATVRLERDGGITVIDGDDSWNGTWLVTNLGLVLAREDGRIVTLNAYTPAGLFYEMTEQDGCAHRLLPRTDVAPW